MATLRKPTRRGDTILPAGAWHVCDTTWGESQRVRLVTGAMSLVDAPERVRSIHAVGFLRGTVEGEEAQVLLVQNQDGSYTFPGGRLEGTETSAEALRREVWEEARATLLPGDAPVAATRIEFLNRVPGRIHRVHPSYLLWVVAEIASLSDEACIDPAPNGVVGRRVVSVSDARALLSAPASLVLDAALAMRKGGD
ncbi:MAG: NUDIX domain-containing protein [Armatimonadetes bacterium]|nr:NUDIX domain-containing protein [Armatimonadota bacterium]